MKMIDLRNLILKKLNADLSSEEKYELMIHINCITKLIAKDLDMPISGLFLLKDMQVLPSSVETYIRKHFDL